MCREYKDSSINIFMTTMNIFIDDTSSHKSLLIEDLYKLFIVENVVRYSYDKDTIHNIHVSSEPVTGQEQHYFVIDLVYHEAFMHWVFESAIYLPIFHHLKKIYKDMKLVLNGRKQYKTLFLNFFAIPESDIVYQDDMSAKNICLFPSPISSLNANSISETYKKILSNFLHVFQTYIHSVKQKYDCIVMPRQTKENYVANDRTYDMTHIYKSLNEKNIKYLVLNTDEITDLTEQITSVRSSSNIILVDGSAFTVNNIFCIKSKIFVIGNITPSQAQRFVKLKYIIDTISKVNGNTIVYLGNRESPSLE
jgi:hypothetical protein